MSAISQIETAAMKSFDARLPLEPQMPVRSAAYYVTKTRESQCIYAVDIH